MAVLTPRKPLCDECGFLGEMLACEDLRPFTTKGWAFCFSIMAPGGWERQVDLCPDCARKPASDLIVYRNFMLQFGVGPKA